MENNREQEDLGLGEKVIQENRTRFINKDGSFNVYRKGVLDRGRFSPYHAILNLSWARFFLGVLAYYAGVNLLFALFFLLSGRDAFPEIAALGGVQRFGQLFYYSVQVVSTLGSSTLHPATTVSEILLALESMIGLFGFALGASLLFARFSNPAAGIVFSEKAVISPFKDGTAFMVRMINGRNNELVDVHATLTLSMVGSHGRRNFHQLSLERQTVSLFPLNWTVVHPITEDSPIYNMGEDELRAANAEIILAVMAVDQDLSKTLYVRTSYTADEIVVGARFGYILERDKNGAVVVDPARIGEMEKLDARSQ